MKANHISLPNQLNMVKHEKYDDTISTLGIKVNDISETASQAFNTTSTNFNGIVNINMDIMNFKKSNKETAEKLDVFYNVPGQKYETHELTKVILTNLVAEKFNWDQQDVKNDIVRAYRSGKKQDGKARLSCVKFNREDVDHEIESGFIGVIRRGTMNIWCSKQFTPEVQTRRKMLWDMILN